MHVADQLQHRATQSMAQPLDLHVSALCIRALVDRGPGGQVPLMRLEAQPRVEGDRPFDLADGEGHVIKTFDVHIRPFWDVSAPVSAIRNTFAAAVRAGFTAAEDGNTEVSASQRFAT